MANDKRGAFWDPKKLSAQTWTVDYVSKKKKEGLAECLIVQGDPVGYQIITIKLLSTMLLSWILMLFFEVATTTISLKFYPVLIKVSSVSPFKKDLYNTFFPSPPLRFLNKESHREAILAAAGPKVY